MKAPSVDPETFARLSRLPCWRGDVEIAPLEGGLSNRNFAVDCEAGRFVVRLTGGDVPQHGIVRARELAATKAAHLAGVGPELVHAEDGLVVVRRVDGLPLTPELVRDRAMLSRIALTLRACHREVGRKLRGPASAFWVFHALRDYLGQLEDAGRPDPRTADLRAAIDRLEGNVGPVEVVFAHNDLVPGNLIDDGRRLWLIDWEFAGFGAALFDLAGAAIAGDLDHDLQQHLLRAYFGHPPEPARRRAFAAMRAAALLRETLWGRVQHARGGGLGLDYVAYADAHEKRFDAAYAEATAAERLG